jgi:uncharacterized protein (DUF1015 family)
MATILPFRALRYSKKAGKKASGLLAPPYDVISRDLKKSLLENSPYNAIRLILGNPSVEDHKVSDYAGAAKTLNSWRAKDVLQRDPQPTIYVYQQVFKVEGKVYRRTGFLALSKLEPFGRSKGGILAHEFTLAGPKADRLKLMKQAHANFSAIFSLYPDKDGVGNILARVTSEKPDFAARYPQDVENRLWTLSDPTVLAALQERMAGATLFIADGHHRYETALAYQAHVRKNDRSPLGSRPYDWVMMMFVAMEDPGLVILPTHRCLAPGRISNPMAFLEELTKLGKLSVAPGNLKTLKPMKTLEEVGRKAPTLGISFDGETLYMLTILKAAANSKALTGLSKTQKGLDVTLLHRLILEPKLGISKERVEHEIFFTHKAVEAQKRLAKNDSGVVFFLNPTRIDQLRNVAGAGERMPQKSTYFYPKLVTGMAFNDLSSF